MASREALFVIHADCYSNKNHLRTLTTNTTCELDILGHDRDALGMDGTEVGILEQAYEVGLGRLLQCAERRGLEAQIGLEVLGDFAYETLEW